MNILSVVGARMQLIKAAPVSAALRAADLHDVVVHTGQHYDREMSQQSFEELEIPEPAYNLGVGSGPHGRQTGQILIALEEVLQAERPEWVLVFGNTNSTLAGALAAVKLGLRVAERLAGGRRLFSAAPGIPWLQRNWEAA